MIADWILDTVEHLGKKVWKAISDTSSATKKESDLLATKLQEAKTVQEQKPVVTAPKEVVAPTISTTAKPVAVTQPVVNPTPTVEKAVPEAKPQLLEGNKVVYRIKPFKDNEYSTGYRQTYLKSFMALTQSVQYVISGNRASIALFAVMPEEIAIYFENAFYSSYPTSELIRESYTPLKSQYRVSYGKDDVLVTDKDFMKEGWYLGPLKDIFGVFDNVQPGDQLSFSYTYTFKKDKSTREKWKEKAKKLFSKIFPKKEEAKTEESKEKPEDALKCDVAIGIAFSSKDAAMQQGMKLTTKAIFAKFLHKGWVQITPEKKTTQMNLSQVANFFHIPTKDIFVNVLDYAVYRKLSYPPKLPTTENTERNALTLLGKTDYRGQEVRFGIKDEDSFRHLYIVGKTGTGKSTFLSNIIKSHMYTNKGLCLIDPHGDLVDTVMQHVPSRRTNDVILFDVGDTSHPIGFNLLQYNTEDEKNLIVSGVVSVFKKLFSNSWGPRLEYVLRNVMLSVVEYPNATILHIMRVLTDKNFREEVLENVKDPIVLKFRRTEFDKRSDVQRNEAIAPITNKVGQFLSSSIVRNVFGQPSSKLNMRKVMDEGKILLVNLSKWRIGEDNTEMIGSFIVTKLQIDAMSRTDIPEQERRPFYLHIDEFQNFATDSFAVILSEARKYRLALIVANQYTSQLNDVIRDAIFGNVWSMVSFNVWFDDASMLAQQFKWLITANDLISLPKFRAYIRLMVDGIMSDPFSMGTLPLGQPEASQEIKDKIRQQSRQRYAMERGKLEELVQIWANKTFSPVEKAMERAKADNTEVVRATGPSSLPPVPKAIATSIPPAMPTMPVAPKVASPTVTPEAPKPDILTAEKRELPDQEETLQLDSNLDEHGMKRVEVNSVWIPTSTKTSFGIEDVKVGDWFDGIVKLKYNYGMFVMVKSVEWLLHKNFIKVPDWISRKDIYNIGDKIRVKVAEFKEVNGEKRVVWTQE
jgi:hypothetical protein